MSKMPRLAGAPAVSRKIGGAAGDVPPSAVATRWMCGRSGGGSFSRRFLRIAATLLRLTHPRKHACTHASTD